MAQEHYDVIVIGAGAAGSTAASTAAERGARVALIERDKLGGTCLNYGCDPTKTLLNIATMLYQAQHAEKYGLDIPAVQAQWEQVQAYVREVVTTIRGGTPEQARAELREQGIELYQGEATFVSPYELSVDSAQGQQTLTGERIVITSGSQTMVPPIEGLRETGFITNVEAISLPSLPQRMAVVGGGPIGIEFAQMFSRFGVQVTVIERSPQMLEKEDRELADILCDVLTKEGIHLHTGAELRRVQATSQGKLLTIKHESGDEEPIEVDEILLAIGRRPMLEGLHLEAAGVKTEKKGIVVDATLRTSVPHIWAAGDVLGGYQFTHVASEQGKIVAHNAFSRDALQSYDDRVIPWVTYTSPALSHVGKTEEQLREEGVEYKVGRMKFSELERAITNGKTEGLIKLLVDGQGKLLGGHILGVDADDLLAPIIVAMHANLSVDMLASSIMPYPTLSEGVRWAADQIS